MDNPSGSFVPGLEIREASREELFQVGDLARLIFPDTYEHIVSADQISYMMELFYSPESLQSQFDSGQSFLILLFEGKPAGYASYTKLGTVKDFTLNKIYLDRRIQGKGFGRFLLFDVIRRVKYSGGGSLRLNVNRNNKAVGFYRKMGFTVIKEQILDIGGGHHMDDFVMKIKIL